MHHEVCVCQFLRLVSTQTHVGLVELARGPGSPKVRPALQDWHRDSGWAAGGGTSGGKAKWGGGRPGESGER